MGEGVQRKKQVDEVKLALRGLKAWRQRKSRVWPLVHQSRPIYGAFWRLLPSESGNSCSTDRDDLTYDIHVENCIEKEIFEQFGVDFRFINFYFKRFPTPLRTHCKVCYKPARPTVDNCWSKRRPLCNPSTRCHERMRRQPMQSVRPPSAPALCKSSISRWTTSRTSCSLPAGDRLSDS